MIRDGLVFPAVPVNPEPDFYAQFTRIGLDVNIRTTLFIAVHNYLVDKFNNGTVIL
jgi:hypothetical protein